MRLFSTFLIGAAIASRSTRNSWKKLEREGTSKYDELKKVTSRSDHGEEITEIERQWEVSIKEGTQQVDVFAGRTSLIDRNPGQCSLHWNLCPNHCTLDHELPDKFTKIRGNIMAEHKNYQDRVSAARDEIVEDLKGKMDEFNGLMTDISKNRNELEAQESRFLATLQQDYQRVQSVNDRLMALRDNAREDKQGYMELNKRASDAYDSCYDQAPCFGTQRCRFGVPSGSSCADIVEDLAEKTAYQSELRVSSGVYMVNAGAAGAKPVQCEFSSSGNAWTVFHHYENRTYSAGNWKNGFGEAASFGDAACGPANYWAGDDFIDAVLDNSDKLLAQKDNDVSVFNIQSSRGQYQASNGSPMCDGGATLDASAVSNVLNNHRGYEQFTRLAVGQLKEKNDHPKCLAVGNYDAYGPAYGATYGEDGDYNAYGAKDYYG